MARLTDSSINKNFDVTSYINKYNQKIFKYSFNFKLPIRGVLKEVFEKNFDKQPQNDPFWTNVYCVNGLIDIEKVSEDIARLFCEHVTGDEVIGKIKNYKLANLEYLINIFTVSFVKIANKYNSTGVVWFNFDTESDKTYSEGELMEKLTIKFNENYGRIEKEIIQDFNIFKSEVSHKIQDLINLKEQFPLFSSIDKNSEEKLSLRIITSLIFNHISDKTQI